MSPSTSRPDTLVIGWDAAEQSLVTRLLEQRRLPNLADLLRTGAWSDVIDSAAVGSGTVWPTFVTGTLPQQHGAIGEWRWEPEHMRQGAYAGGDLQPYWRAWPAQGWRLGVLDMPFLPIRPDIAGFQVSEWGTHDHLTGKTTIEPPELAHIVAAHSPHPFQHTMQPLQRVDVDRAHEIARRCQASIGMRGDLALGLLAAVPVDVAVVVFSELHYAGHLLWHTLAWAGPEGELLENLYVLADEQLGRLVESCPAGTRILVTSLHGMRPSRGIPTLLGQLLSDLGEAHGLASTTSSPRDLAVKAFGNLKRAMPAGLRSLYRRRVPMHVQRRLAQPTMVAPHDWSRTRAFALHADQHGWLRVNLEGREAKGIVAQADYDSFLDTLSAQLAAAIDAEGRPLVARIVRTSPRPHPTLPDLVVHWTEDAEADPVILPGGRIASSPIGLGRSSQHTERGFAVHSNTIEDLPSSVDIAELHRWCEPARAAPA